MHMTDISQAKQWQKDRDGGLTKKENVCGTKEGLHRVYTGRHAAAGTICLHWTQQSHRWK